ncbi:MAG: hypothetical protein HZA80_01765 [Candidatus Taylorbacteria bacterium]|nr:hypothetical protein [Candidatus Taylorbacteria bacterium]
MPTPAAPASPASTPVTGPKYTAAQMADSNFHPDQLNDKSGKKLTGGALAARKVALLDFQEAALSFPSAPAASAAPAVPAGTPAATPTLPATPSGGVSRTHIMWAIVILLLALLGLTGWLAKSYLDKRTPAASSPVGGASGGQPVASESNGITGIIPAGSVTNVTEDVEKRRITLTGDVLVTNVTKRIHTTTVTSPGGAGNPGGFILNQTIQQFNGSGQSTLPTNDCRTNRFGGVNPRMSPEVARLAQQGKLKTYEASEDGTLPQCIHVPSGEAAVILMPEHMDLVTRQLNRRNIAVYFDERTLEEEKQRIASGVPSISERVYLVNRDQGLTPAQVALLWSNEGSNEGLVAAR